MHAIYAAFAGHSAFGALAPAYRAERPNPICG